MVTVETESKHRGQSDDDVVGEGRGVSYGPYDISELTDADREHMHLSYGGDVVVKTRSLWFRVLRGSKIYELTRDDGFVEGLLVEVPGVPDREAMALSISVSGSPKSQGFWETTGFATTLKQMDESALSPEKRDVIWGDAIYGHVDQKGGQEFFIIGVDGPRWVLKVVAYGHYMSDASFDYAMEVVNSCIVNRGSAAVVPGTPLDVTILKSEE